MTERPSPPFVLTIAGLDPSGGAGATADLRVFRALGCYGLSALTAITPQNTHGVRSVHPLPPEVLREQLEAVLDDFPVAAAKTGQIPNLAAARVIVETLEGRNIPLVVDPVLVPTRGRRLADEDAALYVKRRLLPLAALVTPNEQEAEWLTGLRIDSVDEAEAAARAIAPAMCAAAVVTGGDGLDDDGRRTSTDVFSDGQTLRRFAAERRPGEPIHGTGCHYSAAAVAYLALGHSTEEAARRAKAQVTDWIDHALLRPAGAMRIIHS